MSTLFHMAKPPMPEQQNQSGWSWPTPHCKGAHLDPSVPGEASVKQIHSAQCTQHSRKISCHLHKGKLPPVILFCARVQWLGIQYQHKLSKFCPWGWQQLFSHSSCAAKGHEQQRAAQVPLPLCAHDFFLICRCPNFPQIRTKRESWSSWELLLASWLLKRLLKWVQFGKLFGSFPCTFPN